MLSSGNAFVWNLVHGVGLCYMKDIADMGAVVVVHSNSLSLYRVHAQVKFQLCFIFQVAPPHKDLVVSSTHEMNTKNKTTEVLREKEEGGTLKRLRKRESMHSVVCRCVG